MNGHPLRVAVIGLGKIAQLHHLPNLAELPEYVLTAVCDLAPGLANRMAESFGTSSTVACTDYRELLDGQVDALVVANRHHGPVIRDALRAGVPVFVEKPVCWGLAEAAELRTLQAETGVPVVVGYMKRYDPAVERLCGELPPDQPIFVRVHNFAGGRHRHERLYPVAKPAPDEVPAGGEDAAIDAIVRAELGGADPLVLGSLRMLAELAIHDINLLRALAGDVEVRSASVQRTAAGLCVVAILHNSRLQATIEILPDFTSARDWDEHITLYRPGGSHTLVFGSPFVRNLPTTVLENAADGTDSVSRSLLVSRDSPYRRELRHFHAVVTNGVQPRTPLAAAAEDLAVVYRIARQLAAAEVGR